MAAYITNADVALYYDSRRLLELCSDSGTEETTLDNAILTELLLAASAEIDANCQQGKRYAKATLEAMTGKGATLLKQLCADLAFGSLMARRGFAADQMKVQAPRYEAALLTLEMLYQGRKVFDLDANINAGVPKVAVIGKNQIRGSQFNRMFGLWPDASTDSRGFLYGNWR